MMHKPSLFIPSLTATEIGHTCAFQFHGTFNGHRHHDRHRTSSISSTRLLHNGGFFGLTDDGDFAILGVNMQDNVDDDDNDTNPLTSSSGQDSLDMASFLTGTIFDNGAKSVGKSVDTVAVTESNNSLDRDTLRNTSQKIRSQRTINPQTQADIAEYLTQIMPIISKDEIEQYSIELDHIGFHPNCVSACELKLEDLDFMKVLHGRYFYKVVMDDHSNEDV
jgi:hypothetical protein